MKKLVWLVALSISGDQLVHAAPMTVNGVPFTLVATGPGTAQLFGLTSDAQGNVYIGNNSNNTTGIPVQLFKPSLFSGSPISLQDFGPAVGDADGLAFGGGYIYAPDQNEGLRRTLVPGGASSVFLAGKSINGTGSPVVYRPSDGHVFIGFGSTVPGVPGAKRIDEYNSSGTFVHTFTTAAETETMTFDSASGLIYYAAFGSEVRAFNPLTSTDSHVGNTSGFIDGGLALDPIERGHDAEMAEKLRRLTQPFLDEGQRNLGGRGVAQLLQRHALGLLECLQRFEAQPRPELRPADARIAPAKRRQQATPVGGIEPESLLRVAVRERRRQPITKTPAFQALAAPFAARLWARTGGGGNGDFSVDLRLSIQLHQNR
jgi:hypothetical protein